MRGDEVLSFFAGSAILRNRQILRIKLKREVKLDGCRIWKDLGLGFVLVGASLSGLGATNLMRNSCYPAPLGRGETTNKPTSIINHFRLQIRIDTIMPTRTSIYIKHRTPSATYPCPN